MHMFMIGMHALHTVSSCCMCTDKCVYVEDNGYKWGFSIGSVVTSPFPAQEAHSRYSGCGWTMAVGTSLRLSIPFLKWTEELGREGLGGGRGDPWCGLEQSDRTKHLPRAPGRPSVSPLFYRRMVY